MNSENSDLIEKALVKSGLFMIHCIKIKYY